MRVALPDWLIRDWAGRGKRLRRRASGWLRDELGRLPALREVYFASSAWGGHQDVFGFVKT